MKKSIIALAVLGTLSSSAVYAMDYESNAYTDKRIETTNKYVEKRVGEESAAAQAAANDYTNQKFELSNKYTDKRSTEEAKAAEANANKYTDQRVEVANKYTDKRIGEVESNLAQHESVITSVVDQLADDGAAISDLQTNVSGNIADIKNLQDDSALHETAIIANSGKIGENEAAININKDGIAANKAGVATNAANIVKTQKEAKDYTDKTAKQTLSSSYSYTDKQVGAEAVARAEGDRQTLKAANGYTNQKFAELGKRVDKVRKEANAGTASALAASQIPQVEANGRFALGAGVGGYNSQTAVAVGFSARINERVVTKFAVTTDTAHNVGYGAGVAVSW